VPNTQEEISSPYNNGPYLVLSDNSTFDRAEDCYVAFITDEGEKALEECYEFKAVDVDQVEIILVSDLLDAYNKVHGTNL
jgi:hypothetical protein